MTDEQRLPEVTRFVVKLPNAYAARSRDLCTRLGAAFPDRKFTLEASEQTFGGRLAIVPVMEDRAGRAQICRAPDRSLITRIHDVLNEFAFGYEATPA